LFYPTNKGRSGFHFGKITQFKWKHYYNVLKDGHLYVLALNFKL